MNMASFHHRESSPRVAVRQEIEDDELGASEQNALSHSNSDNHNTNRRGGWWVAETSSTYSPSGASPSSSSSSSSSSLSSTEDRPRILIPSPSSGSLPYDEQEYHKRNGGVVSWGRRRDGVVENSNINSPSGTTIINSHNAAVVDRATRLYVGPRRRIGRPPLATTSLGTVDTTSGSSGTTISTPASPLRRHRPSMLQNLNHLHNHHHHEHRPMELDQTNVMLIQQRRRRGRRNQLSALASPQNRSPSRRKLLSGASAGYEYPTNSNNFPPPPQLKTIAWELSFVCLYYIRYSMHNLQNYARSLNTPLQRTGKILAYIASGAVLFVALLVLWLWISFRADAIRICTPPPGYSYDGQRPLVEYYVHGRGIGHYARSVAIVNQLNEAGVDVRLFLARASHWRALHEDRQQHQQQKQTVITDTLLRPRDEFQAAASFSGLGTTSAFAVTSLKPSLNFFEALSNTLERIMGDCEVAHRSNRYPIVVVTDADLPGMLRAKFGGIPSVGIAHGQLFHIAQKPAWIAANKRLSKSWDRQGSLNYYSSFYSSWQIATHFCYLETKVPTGVVARAPLRAEIQSMSQFRKRASRRGRHTHHHRHKVTNSSSIPQEERIRKLLWYGSEYANVTVTPKIQSRRKVVISYFRDHNGQRIQRALLQAGFDVLNFDNGYSKEEYRDPNRYGAKWIVDPNENFNSRRHRLRIFGSRVTKPKSSKKQLRYGRHNRDRQDGVPTTPDKNQSRRRRLTETTSTLGGSEEGSSAPRLIRVTDRSLFVPLMHVADGVVSSAGSQLMSECIYAGMPLLALYLERDDEQRLNVELSHHDESACAHPHQIVFGSSLEDLMQSGALLLASANATSSTISTTTGTSRKPKPISPLEDARLEFVKFLEAVRASPISQAYYDDHDDEPLLLQGDGRPPLIALPATLNSTATSFASNTNGTFAEDSNSSALVEPKEVRREKVEENDVDDDETRSDEVPKLIARKEKSNGISKIFPHSDFQGLPDAAAVILEIIKQQVQQHRLQSSTS